MTSLKIVIVAGPDDENCIRKNIQLIKTLNQNGDTAYSVDIIDNGFMIDPSLGFQHDLESARILLGHPPFNSYPTNCKASYQHASALNQYIHSHSIKEEFLLVLDPDFFITRKSWIDDITLHAYSRNLSFFGSLWSPLWFNKYRDFPTVHCMLINTKLVDIKSLDFLPDLEITKETITPSNRCLDFSFYDYISFVIDFFPSFNKKLVVKLKANEVTMSRNAMMLISILNKFSSLAIHIRRLSRTIKVKASQFTEKIKKSVRVATINRKIVINSSKDTGFKVLICFSNSTRHEELVSYINYTNLSLPHLKFKLFRWIEELLPNKLSYLPLKETYKSGNCSLYREFTDNDILEYGFEEFIWRNERFAFHMRRFNKTNRDKDWEFSTIDRIISGILSHTHEK